MDDFWMTIEITGKTQYHVDDLSANSIYKAYQISLVSQNERMHMCSCCAQVIVGKFKIANLKSINQFKIKKNLLLIHYISKDKNMFDVIYPFHTKSSARVFVRKFKIPNLKIN